MTRTTLSIAKFKISNNVYKGSSHVQRWNVTIRGFYHWISSAINSLWAWRKQGKRQECWYTVITWGHSKINSYAHSCIKKKLNGLRQSCVSSHGMYFQVIFWLPLNFIWGVCAWVSGQCKVLGTNESLSC